MNSIRLLSSTSIDSVLFLLTSCTGNCANGRILVVNDALNGESKDGNANTR